MSDCLIFQDNSIIFLLLPMLKENKGSLSNVRVLKKTMIFLQSYEDIIPLQILKSTNTFAPCGSVETVKTKQNYKNTTTYVTFSQQESAALALLAFYHLNSRLRVLFGTVQYCKYFMRKAQCRNQNCVFLHVRDKKNQIIVNEQIDDEVYDDHYDMALKILEVDNFKTLKNIVNNKQIDENNIIKKGLKRAVQDLNIQLECEQPKEIYKYTDICEQSTQESDLTDSREQRIYKTEQLNVNFKEQDYIKIRLIKKLIRENNSKFHSNESNQQQIHNRSKMILYQIVKN